jgi:hypothetical protein
VKKSWECEEKGDMEKFLVKDCKIQIKQKSERSSLKKTG